MTGGAGYIGSVTVAHLQSRGQRVIVLDDLSRGHRRAVDPNLPFYVGNVGDKELIAKIVNKHKIDACIHFAAFAYVGESVREPRLYFENNVSQGLALLEGLLQTGVQRFVFSSSCAIYGESQILPIKEDAPQWPTSTYGWSKLLLERALVSYGTAYGLRFVALRYFNAAGATEMLGEHHDPETHLIPNVLLAASGVRSHVSIFGDGYPTPDGTAIRDYIHVSDLAEAHAQAVDFFERAELRSFLT